MFGLGIAASYAVLRLALTPALPETVAVETTRFLLVWYGLAGLAALALAGLAWAGDLGSEGARLRHGVATPLAWGLGVARIPLASGLAVLALAMRRVLLGLGALGLSCGIRPVGAEFAVDGRMLLVGALTLALGLVAGGLRALLRRRLPPPTVDAAPPIGPDPS